MLRLIFRASSITVLLLLGFPLIGSVDTTIKFWDIKTGKERAQLVFESVKGNRLRRFQVRI